MTDLAAKLKERDRKIGAWSQTQYSNPNGKDATTVHRSQLRPKKEKIYRLSVENSDGSIIDISEPDGKLKFTFTGGNDDPSIELHLIQFGPAARVDACPSTIIYKFAAFPASESTAVYHGRKVHKFSPKWGSNSEDQKDDLIIGEEHRGPTSFTESLYDLCWELFMKGNLECVRLSWKAKSMTTFGLSLARDANLEHADIARMYSSIAKYSADHPGTTQAFTVELRHVWDVRYRYRFLLACEINLQAYWRYRLVPSPDRGSIPSNLCDLLPLSSREIQQLELKDPLSNTFDMAQRFYLNTLALNSVYSFCSVPHAESYLKGAFLYEEHALSKLRQRYLNIPWQTEFHKLGRGGDGNQITFWIAILTPPSFFSRKVGTEILPKQGNPVIVKWKLRRFGTTIHTDQASGLFLGAEIGMNNRASMAVLVCSKSADTNPLEFQARKYEVTFDFSPQPANLDFLLDSMDNLLLFDSLSEGNKETAAQIFDVLMARDNHKVMYDAHLSPAYDPTTPQMMRSLDEWQQVAMIRLERKLISIIDGPHGSGKTMLAALLGVCSLQAGEKVTFLASTKAGLKELFLQVKKFCEELKLPAAFMEGFSCVETQDWVPCEAKILDEILAKIQLNEQYQIHRVKELPSQKSASKKSAVPTAVFGLYDELERLDCQNFGNTLLICDEAERAHDHSIFAACGLFISTLKKVALFGNSDKVPIEIASRELNHLRNQLQLTTFSRLICTGVDPIRLNKQYAIDPNISALPMRYMNWDNSKNRSTLRILDGVEHSNFPARYLMQLWAAKYLQKEISDARVSVFANVLDGVCLQDAASHTTANHHNMVAILQIIRSMMESKLTENIIVITFHPEAAVAMRKFLKSQGITQVRVEHADSQRIKSKENQIAIIDCPAAGDPKAQHRTQYERYYPSLSTADWLRKNKIQRLVSALCIARGLRVFVGSSTLLQFESSYEWPYATGNLLLKNLMKSHMRDEQTKYIKIGHDLLEYEEVLRPGDYVLASNTSRSAEKMYRELGPLQDASTEISPSNETGGQTAMPWLSETVTAAAATTGVSERNMNGERRTLRHNGTENNGAGLLDRSRRMRPDVVAPQISDTSSQTAHWSRKTCAD